VRRSASGAYLAKQTTKSPQPIKTKNATQDRLVEREDQLLSNREGSNAKRDRFGPKTIVTSVAIAIVSAAIGYMVSLIEDHRKTKIQEVNLQIEKVYGPLYACSVASKRAFEDLMKARSGKSYFFSQNDPPSAELVELWRRWMKSVLMPMNIKMESAIIDNSQLLDGARIYPSFVELISHVESYKATIASWKETDDLTQAKFQRGEANAAIINFPVQVNDCIKMRLDAAIKRRNELQASWFGFFGGSSDNFPPDCS
jgi:hypothetical protein